MCSSDLIAEEVKVKVDKSGAWKRPVVTEITPASAFWTAEEYHQDYLKKNPNGKIQFHTCGALAEPFMRAMLDCGVDGHDPLPPKVARHSNPAARKRLLGKEMFFYGGIDVQETLPWGSMEDVRAEVRARIWEMGHGGGFLVSSSHRLEHDVPTENVLAMIDECHEYGVYPLPDQPPPLADTGEGYEPWSEKTRKKRPEKATG